MDELCHLYNGEFRARSVLVTGCNQGIGLELVKSICRAKRTPLHLFAACINPLEAQGFFTTWQHLILVAFVIAVGQILCHETKPRPLYNYLQQRTMNPLKYNLFPTELNALAATHPCLQVLQLDLTDNISIEEMACVIDKIVGKHGLNCLINNAGVSLGGGLSRITAQRMLDNYTVNVVGPLMLIKALIPCLKRASSTNCHLPPCCARACVINMSSVLGSLEHVPETRGGQYAYRSSKASLNMLTRCLSFDLSTDNIITVSLHPGWVRTNMGGPQAPLSANESACGCLATISSLNASDNGRFLDWKGQVLPW